MCKYCGCNSNNEVKIDGVNAENVNSPLLNSATGVEKNNSIKIKKMTNHRNIVG